MSVQTATTHCVLDYDHALLLLGGDRQLYGELVGFVLEDAPLLLSEIGDAVRNANAATVRLKAHALKGLVASCGGVRAASAAQKVETAGEKADLIDIQPLVEELKNELSILTPALREYSA